MGRGGRELGGEAAATARRRVSSRSGERGALGGWRLFAVLAERLVACAEDRRVRIRSSGREADCPAATAFSRHTRAEASSHLAPMSAGLLRPHAPAGVAESGSSSSSLPGAAPAPCSSVSSCSCLALCAALPSTLRRDFGFGGASSAASAAASGSSFSAPSASSASSAASAEPGRRDGERRGFGGIGCFYAASRRVELPQAEAPGRGAPAAPRGASHLRLVPRQ